MRGCRAPSGYQNLTDDAPPMTIADATILIGHCSLSRCQTAFPPAPRVRNASRRRVAPRRFFPPSQRAEDAVVESRVDEDATLTRTSAKEGTESLIKWKANRRLFLQAWLTEATKRTTRLKDPPSSDKITVEVPRALQFEARR